MLNPFRLLVFQRRQLGHGWRFGFVENGLGHRLQCAQPRPFEVARVADLSQKAPPFDNDTVNIPGTNQIGDPAMLVQGVFVHGSYDLFRSCSVFGWDSIFEVTWD